MASPSSGSRRMRGQVEPLPSGSLRVRVFTGRDPLTKSKHFLEEVVPAGPKAAAQAEKVRTRLLAEVDERRNARTNATVNQLFDRYLGVLNIEATTREGYERNARLHIRPILGQLPIGRIDGETIDSFYAQLRRCRAHCNGRRYVEHRTDRPHECDDRCGPHKCQPLSEASIRHVHNLLNGAFARAVKWRWIGTNPIKQAQAPVQPTPDPQPPSPSQAARIAMEAWKDPEWGMFVWLAMTSGARRGELCALRWDRIDFESGVASIRSSIAQSGRDTWAKDTKTHQQRRIVLDAQTLALLRAYLAFSTNRATDLSTSLAHNAYVFSSAPDGSSPLKPDTVTQRYRRMCARLGWDMHIHQLRHYSATELLTSGVDLRTVAGRLGHGDATTTLRFYTAWVAEADQRAARSLSARMPELPAALAVPDVPALPAAPVRDADLSPYQRIAADLRAAIRCGALNPGDFLPTVKSLAARYEVSEGTAHRAVSELVKTGEAAASRGKRAAVLAPDRL